MILFGSHAPRQLGQTRSKNSHMKSAPTKNQLFKLGIPGCRDLVVCNVGAHNYRTRLAHKRETLRCDIVGG